MGADWIRLTENRYRDKIQKQATEKLGSGGMFLPDEITTITYPCFWLNEKNTFPVGTKLFIFQRTPKSRVAVMNGLNAVAEVRGSAARDLQQLFNDKPNFGRMLEVVITRLGKPSEPFYVAAKISGKKSAVN
jgi:hypothetical protein